MAAPLRLKEIAASLKLSVPTVSLALRNAGNISAKTCARVQRVAAAMGYRPNLYAAALSTGRQPTHAHDMPLALIRWSLPGGVLYPVDPFTEGIKKRGAALGYHIESCTLSSPRELPRCLRLLYNQGIQGIFIAPVGDFQEALKLDWSRFCVVACGRYDVQTPFHTVRPEIFESTRAVMLQTIQRGYKRIGAALYHHSPPMIDDFARLSAIQGGITSPNQPRGTHSILFSRPDEYLRLPQWAREKRLDALIIFSVGQYHTLVEHGLLVPDDLGVVTLHHRDDLYSRHISGVVQRDEDQGATAAVYMDHMIRHHERGVPRVPQHIVIGGEWIEGTTLPDKNLDSGFPSAKRRRQPAKIS